MDTVRQPSGAARLSFIVPHLSKSVHQVWFGGVNRAHYLDKRALSILDSLNLREKPVEVAAEMVRVKTVAGLQASLAAGMAHATTVMGSGDSRDVACKKISSLDGRSRSRLTPTSPSEMDQGG